jgi:hypothetical protein
MSGSGPDTVPGAMPKQVGRSDEGEHPINAFDMLAEIGVGSVERDTRRHILGHEALSARYLTAQGYRRDPIIEPELTWRPRWHGANPRALTIVIAATRGAVGSALVRVGRRVQGATGPDAASGAAAPLRERSARPAETDNG